jgi:glycosyltransferase involved in cell wall biosynthesis
MVSRKQPLLSLITFGKNDNYGGDEFYKTIKLPLSKLIECIKDLPYGEIEIVCVDWGSDPDNKLSDIMGLEKCDYLKYVYVSPKIASKYDNIFSIPHALNCGIRNSLGEYILAFDADSYINFHALDKIYNTIKNLKENNINNIFYWFERWFIPYNDYIEKNSFTELDDWIQSNPSKIWLRNPLSVKEFGGHASAFLVKKTEYEESTGYWEIFNKWGYMDYEWHIRYSRKNICVIFPDIKIYQKYHHDVDTRSHRERNTSKLSPIYNVNGENWGLGNEVVKIYN